MREWGTGAYLIPIHILLALFKRPECMRPLQVFTLGSACSLVSCFHGSEGDRHIQKNKIFPASTGIWQPPYSHSKKVFRRVFASKLK